MTETKINVSDLKNEGSDLVKDLTTFLEEKTKTKVESGTNEITVTEADERSRAPVSRTYLRMLLRKFLHKKELKEYYRVIGGKDNTLIVKEKKVKEQEEE